MFKLAKGTQLLIGDGAGPEVFTAIPGVVEFQPPDSSWSMEDTTSNDNETKVTTQLPTVRTVGALMLTIKPWDVDSPTHNRISDLAQSGALNNFKLVYPGSTLGTFGPFSAAVSVDKPITPVKGLYARAVTLSPVGDILDALPRLLSVAVVDTQAGAYVTAEKITLRATFDEYVKVVAGPGPVYPRIPITLTSGTVYAVYVPQMTPTNTLTFEYTFGGGDAAAAGHVSIGSPVQLNTGSITDMIGGAPAALTFSVPNTSGFTVN